MNKITVKNITKGTMVIGPELSLKSGESKSFNEYEYTKFALVCDAFHSSLMAEIVVTEADAVEAKAVESTLVDNTEAKNLIKEQLNVLHKEFKHHKTDAARKEQIGLEVAELKEQAAKIK